MVRRKSLKLSRRRSKSFAVGKGRGLSRRVLLRSLPALLALFLQGRSWAASDEGQGAKKKVATRKKKLVKKRAAKKRLSRRYRLPAREFKPPPSSVESIAVSVLQGPPFSLEAETRDAGYIVTTWENYLGQPHGILWWKKSWQERTRYEILVRPNDLEDLEKGSLISVDPMTQTRPNPNYEWAEIESDYAAERAALLLATIVRRIEESS